MRELRLLPVVLLGLTLALEVAAIALSWGLESGYDTLLYAFYSVTLAAAGALIASRHPENAIGWLFCSFALLNALAADAAQGWALRAGETAGPAVTPPPCSPMRAGSRAASAGCSRSSCFRTGTCRAGGGGSPSGRPRSGRSSPCRAGRSTPDAGDVYPSGHNPIAVEQVPTEVLLWVGMTPFSAGRWPDRWSRSCFASAARRGSSACS